MSLRLLFLSVTFSMAAVHLASAQSDECATRADLGQGIALTQSDPQILATIRFQDGNYLETRIDMTGEEPSVRDMARAHYLLLPNDSGANAARHIFPGDLGPLNQMPQIGEFSTPLILEVPGYQPQSGTLELAYLGTEVTQVGACAYTVWRVEMRRVFPDAQDAWILGYAPDLGVLLYVEGGGQPFRYDAIKVVPSG